MTMNTPLITGETPITFSFWAYTKSCGAMDIMGQFCELQDGTCEFDDVRVAFNGSQVDNGCGFQGLTFKSPAHFATAPFEHVNTCPCISSTSLSVTSLEQEECVTTNPNANVFCDDGPVSESYCYGNSDNTIFEYISSDGAPLNLTINSGLIESGWDLIRITDSDGSILFEGDNGGDLAGLTFQSSGDSISLGFQTDSSVNCQDGGTYGGGIDWTVACATCTNPQVDFQIVSDCLNAPQFYIDVNVTDMGSASVLVTDDNQGNGYEFNGVGTYQLGPYPNNTDVQITVTDHDDPNCFVNSGSLTQEYCATTLVDCSLGPVSNSYCYGNGDNTMFEYVSSDGSPLNLTIDSGLIEAGWDLIRIIDSNDTILFEGDNGGDLSGLTFQSSGDTIYLAFQTDGSVSCQDGGTYGGGIDWTVACATCVNPSAEYSVVSDCENGDQFLIDVNITSMGDASTLVINDNYSSNLEYASTTGIVQMGPYPFLTDIVITVSN